MLFFTKLEQIVQKCMWNHNTPPTVTAILRKKNKVGGSILFYYQTILQGHSNQNSMYWHESRHINQWCRIESPEINPQLYGQFIYDKICKNIKWGGGRCWENGQIHAKRNLYHLLTPYIRINPK